ncbi:VirE N-domain protein [Cellulophaga phage phi17:1]|uniref:VirE N-domain protein n=1 Tax=Cellulophaga phage phi17:1 TaxID=1327980 RepID=S0A1E7_9CAUD|nr:VirE N-domain protein [Cellulophaga phage phi17:1]AGO48302.1 VirE N-domain protein [Cellulophaga phage phi17:1]
MNLKDIVFQYFPAKVKSKKPIGSIDLDYVINATGNPSEKVKETFRLIAKAEQDNDMKLKAELKQNNLYYFTPCVWLDGQNRAYKNILSFTGLMVLDFDHIDNAEEFKQFLFNKFDCIIFAFLSPSKKGVKFIVRIPIVKTVEEFKEYYFGMGLDLDKYKGWDGTGQNCVLPLFLSYDENVLFRTDAKEWTKKGKKADFFSAVVVDKSQIEYGDNDKGRIFSNASKAFASIVDNGHPQLRAICISLGGYVASGYITAYEAIEYSDQMIETHSYLRKGVPGYKKTAREAINKGQEKMLKLENK